MMLCHPLLLSDLEEEQAPPCSQPSEYLINLIKISPILNQKKKKKGEDMIVGLIDNTICLTIV